MVGVGRSGTSLLTGILAQLGLHVPQPEVRADETNPRGFSEPRWVVDFHTRLLRERRVTVNDARPAAWAITATAADDDAARVELREWLRGQLSQAGRVAVVKDPRTSWFLPLWLRSTSDLGVPEAFVTMLRHPAETLRSAQKSYGMRQTAASRAAAWINVTLATERATRGRQRAFVRHEDLLLDWSREVNRVGDLLGLPALSGAGAESNPAADAFVDPSLHRHRVRWDELDVPVHLRDMAEDVWRLVQPLAQRDGDGPERLPALDEAWRAYETLYGEAEAVAQSSISAARARRGAGATGTQQRAARPAADPPSLRVRLARRVPARHRKRMRRVLDSLRPS